MDESLLISSAHITHGLIAQKSEILSSSSVKKHREDYQRKMEEMKRRKEGRETLTGVDLEASQHHRHPEPDEGEE